MKALAMAAVVVLVPAGLAQAQLGGRGVGGGMAPPTMTAAEVAESRMDQVAGEVDEALLREALTLLGKHELRVAITKPKDDEESKALNAEGEGLKRFIEARRQAILDRAGKTQPRPLRAGGPVSLPLLPTPENPEEVEKLRNQVQILDIQLGESEQELNRAIEGLARAEVAVRINPEEKADAEAARKTFAEVEASVIDVRKRRREAIDRLTKLDPQGTWRSFGQMGTMRGMGAGMR